VLPVLAAILPVVITPGFLFYFDVTPKVVIVLIGVAVALLLWRGELPTGSRMNRVFLALLAAEAVALGICTAVSTHPALSLTGGNWRRFGLVSQIAVLLFAMLVALDCSSDRNRVAVYLKAMVAGGVPVALYAVLQYFGWDPFLPKQSYHSGDFSWSIIRPPSTMGHASYLATYLLAVAFCCAALLRMRVWRGMAIATSVLCSGAIVLSGTRAALLGLATGAIFAAVSLRVRIRLRPAIALAIGLLVALGVFYWSPAGQPIRNRVTWSSMEPRGGARPLLWRDSLRMSLHHPVFGYGPETFLADFPRFQSRDLARAYPEFEHESPHNIFLDALLSTGVLGTAILALFCLWGIRASRNWPVLGAALVAVITAQFFTSFVLPTAFFFFMILALMVEQSEIRRVPLARFAGACCAVLLAAFAARLFVSDQALASASAALGRGDFAAADRAWQRSQIWALPGAGSDLYYSRRLAEFASASRDFRTKALALRQGFGAAARAPRTSDEPANAWYNLAAFESLTNSAPDVERSLQYSIAAAPNWYKPHWVLAQLYVAEHRMQDARKEAEIAADLNGKEPQVARTLEKIRDAERQ
jgi:hypothetical protein